MPLSPYGRALAHNSGVHSRIKKKRAEEEKFMQEMTIIEDGVEYFEDGRIHQPSRGSVVVISTESLARTLKKAGMAVDGLVPSVREDLAPASEVPVSSEKEGPQATWADVPGISRPSLEMLEQNAPRADLFSATREDLIAWLGGSERRTSLVFGALERWRSSEDD